MGHPMWESLPVLAGTLLGGGALGAIAVKWMNRKIDKATAEQITSQAMQGAKEATQTEVQIMREVLNEVRNDWQNKADQISEYRVELKNIKRRLSLVEERERHMLTRAAVHEAWDQMAFSILANMDPSHPPPPPLGVPKALVKQLEKDLEERNDGSEDEPDHR